jgi:hypothetical protein
MVFNIYTGPTTPKNFQDFLRPAAMDDAEKIFKKIQLNEGGGAAGALNIAGSVSQQMLSLKGSEIDQLWERIEKTLNGRKPLKVEAATDVGRVNTALGLLYASMEVVDKGDSIRNVQSMMNIYSQTRIHVQSRFLEKQKGVDKRTLQRSLDTLDSFFNRVAKRFNKRLEKEEIGGNEITVLFSATG